MAQKKRTDEKQCEWAAKGEMDEEEQRRGRTCTDKRSSSFGRPRAAASRAVPRSVILGGVPKPYVRLRGV